MRRVNIIEIRKQLLLQAVLFVLLSSNISQQLSVNGLQIKTVNDLEINAEVSYIPSSPMLAIDSSDNLYLTFRENIGAYSRISLLRTDVSGDWNLTIIPIFEPEKGNYINSQPAMISFHDKLLLAVTLNNGTKSILKLLEIDPLALELEKLIEMELNETDFCRPRLAFCNQTIWMAWHNNNESNFNLYYSQFNYTSMIQSSVIQISNNASGSCQNSDLFLDKDGICHFIWSQGLDYKNCIFYKSFAENNTCLRDYQLTDNSFYYNDPEIFVENNGQVNTFWSNYSDIANTMLGTRSVQCRTYSDASNWSSYETVAPYRPPDRYDMMTDGENPEATYDNIATLWMAYEIVEPVQYFTGIAIRGRKNGQWLPGEPVTPGQSPAYDPCLVADSEGHIHCVWVDFRWSYYELYYKARYNLDLWSFEVKLTTYTNKEGAASAGKMFGLYITAVVLFGVALPSTYYIAKRIKRKKIIDERRKEIMNE